MRNMEWIPIHTRSLTEEEKRQYASTGYAEGSVSFRYEMKKRPEDEQEVLVTTCFGTVREDIYHAEWGGYFADHCSENDPVAWMPKPEPYKGG